MVTRRNLLAASGAIAATALLPGTLRGVPDATRAALNDSDLVYLTPLKSSGEESTCHAEIWFAYDGDDLYLCTASDAWRTRAIANGLDQARLWVGEYGTWTKSDGKYRDAPQLMATGSIVDDQAAVEHGLELLGDKYSVQWVVWGPRFRSGLADGSRVMLRYSPA